MAGSAKRIDVYLEVGQKRTFAGAIDWPGWCRSGRDEASALAALADYGGRYAAVVKPARLGNHPPADAASLNVVERLPGNATTDFGAPDASPAADAEPMTPKDFARAEVLLGASWAALDHAADSAAGHELRKGPRGGGRDVEKMLHHVGGSEAGYLAKIAGKFRWDDAADPRRQLPLVRQAALDALAAAAHDGLPAHGPRGGTYWTVRYYIRRVAWHALDHAWEIEDRIV